MDFGKKINRWAKTRPTLGRTMQLTFLGATETVTGSKYLLEFDDQRVLIDCGLFQGEKALRSRNWQPLPFDPSTLNTVLLTHAHLDHTGYLPLLVKQGFHGMIQSTHGTKDLCEVLLPDSAHIQEEDAKHANQHHYSKHHPAMPLYTLQDAERALKHFKIRPYGKLIELNQGTHFQFLPAGHIIGSSFVSIQHQGRSLLFTGDLGRMRDDVMKPPSKVQQADYLVIESTYGNQLHEKVSPQSLLKTHINETIQRGGTVIIPAFAVGRTQSILHHLAELKKEQAMPDIPIYLDSPMATNATQVLLHHLEDLNLTESECRALGEVATIIKTVEASIQLDQDKTPKIIIAGSGMLTGGRVLFHLCTYGRDPRNTILLTGFQAKGTRGALLQEGNRQIKLHGKLMEVQAQVEVIGNTSAHADYEEILEWLSYFKAPPKKTFITHGEPAAALALKNHIESQLGWSCLIPTYGEVGVLT